MSAVNLHVENTDATLAKPRCCAECGWPGIAYMPAGVRVINTNGKQVVVGQLSYFRVTTALCSVCQDMKSAAASRAWFVDAHAEYLDQIEVKKQLLAGQ